MDNSLIALTNSIAVCDTKEIAKQVMTVCRAITPQFYKNLTIEEMKAERLSIELLTAGIDQKTLAEMCKRAINNYARIRSENSRVYFDINYLIMFYKESFNFVNCENVSLSKQATLIKSFYDDETHILTEVYEDNKEMVTIREIIDKKEDKQNQRLYSTKFYQLLNNSFFDINI